LYQGEQCDPAVGQPRLLPPWTVWSPPFLPEPTFLLSFLTLSFSISSILHPFPIHDDTFLPTYPIQLILLPINYDDVYPQAGSSTWCTAPASSSSWCTALASSSSLCTAPASSSSWCTAPTSSSSWCTAPASSSTWCTAPASSSSWCTVPAKQATARGVQLQQAEQEDVQGA